MKKLTALAAAAALHLSAWTASATELRMISALPEGFVFTDEIATPFMKLVEEETVGAVTLSMTGPDVVPVHCHINEQQSHELLMCLPVKRQPSPIAT